MPDDTARKARRQRLRAALDAAIDPYRARAPSKAELRAQLADAARNTAALAHGKTRREQAGSPA